MMSTKSLFEEIRANDDAYAFLLSIAAKNESQGGWENIRLAELTGDPALARKIRRHGEDEAKHGRLFAMLLAKRGLAPVEVPFEADYCLRLERLGIGVPHARLDHDDPLTTEEIIAYLVHSRITEQRSAEEIDLQHRVFRDDPELGKALAMVSADEANHLAYCHEELLALVERGHGPLIRVMLRDYAMAEIAVYREVSLFFIRRLAAILGWGTVKTGLLLTGVHAVHASERLWRWRRMVRLIPPARRNALFGTAEAQPAG